MKLNKTEIWWAAFDKDGNIIPNSFCRTKGECSDTWWQIAASFRKVQVLITENK